jgi:hypothetical protein
VRKIYIHNYVDYHDEVLESVIARYYDMCNIKPQASDELFLGVQRLPESSQDYLKNKYTKLKEIRVRASNDFFPFCSDADFYIECSMYAEHWDSVKHLDPTKYFFLFHRYRPNDVHAGLGNCFYPHTAAKNYFPLSTLPGSDNLLPKSEPPVYVVQGNVRKRVWSILDYFFTDPSTSDLDFELRILGKEVKWLKNNAWSSDSRVKIHSNLHSERYHDLFRDAYCMLHLVHPHNKKCKHYYTDTMSSSVNYALAYDLRNMLDDKLQASYNLKDAFIYRLGTAGKDFISVFKQSIKDFDDTVTHSNCTS